MTEIKTYDELLKPYTETIYRTTKRRKVETITKTLLWIGLILIVIGGFGIAWNTQAYINSILYGYATESLQSSLEIKKTWWFGISMIGFALIPITAIPTYFILKKLDPREQEQEIGKTIVDSRQRIATVKNKNKIYKNVIVDEDIEYMILADNSIKQIKKNDKVSDVRWRNVLKHKEKIIPVES